MLCDRKNMEVKMSHSYCFILRGYKPKRLGAPEAICGVIMVSIVQLSFAAGKRDIDLLPN